MDAQRFDNLARMLAGRLSRRTAFRRAGAAASASVLAAAGVRPEPSTAATLARAQADDQPLYTLIRRYTLNVPTGQVRQALQQGYVEDACNAPGFVAYLTVEDEEGDFTTVAVFRSQADLEAFATAEASWVAQNLGDALPAPDEAISGDTYVHAAVQDGFPNTCPAAVGPTAVPAQPTAAPGQPTTAPAQPTAAPTNPTPTPTPAPACTAQGCVCATGTQAPCDDGLVCCPTTDLLGGPGVCQTEAACYPNQCRANGRSCPRSCGTTEACPACCSAYCNGDGVCADPPTTCTGEGCACATGTQDPCDAGLVCCGTSGVPGGDGTCRTEAECNPPCTGQGCTCDNTDTAACDAGLVCCAVQSGFICATREQCGLSPCTGEGCACTGGTQGACDTGLICCAQGDPGAPGTCQTEANCAPSLCTGEGCPCNGGVQGACQDGLVCCQDGQSIPGGAGTCVAEADCAPPPCTGEGCACNGGVQGACDAGLVCCQEGQSIPGGAGTCRAEAACAPPCTDDGGGCDATCNWGDACAGCCSGFCTDTGVCGEAPPLTTCIADGTNCGTTCNWSDACDACCSGFCDGAGNCNEPGASAGACGDLGCGCELGNPACVDGLVCCDDGSGVTGACESGC